MTAAPALSTRRAEAAAADPPDQGIAVAAVQAPAHLTQQIVAHDRLGDAPTARACSRRIAHEREQHERDDQYREGRQGYPPGIDVRLALAQQLAERWCTRRNTETQKIERRQRQDRGAHAKRQKRDHGCHAVGQNVPPHDVQITHAQRPRSANVIQLAVAQKLGAHVIR